MKRSRVKGLLERKMEDPAYRARFEREYPLFVFEVQILRALEQKGWTFDDLAKRLNSSKSNISRDLSAGGIRSATLKRVSKLAQALGMEFVPLLISHADHHRVLPRIQRLVGAIA